MLIKKNLIKILILMGDVFLGGYFTPNAGILFIMPIIRYFGVIFSRNAHSSPWHEWWLKKIHEKLLKICDFAR